MTLYDQSAQAMSTSHFVTEEVATGWIKGHEKTYPVFHQWKQEVSHIATARGWTEVDWSFKIRWCNEDNAKAAGASPGRSGVNFKIQGSGADQCKLALIFVLKELRRTPAKLVGMVHDKQ